jgi:hypothetical protein
MLKPYFGIDDTSLFEAIDVSNETNINVLIPQERSKKKDRIERLPRQPPMNFSQYGSYVTMNRSYALLLLCWSSAFQGYNASSSLAKWRYSYFIQTQSPMVTYVQVK